MIRNKFKIIYVHGFGGNNTYPNQIHRQVNKLADYQLYPDTLSVYNWDSEKVSTLNIKDHWNNALQKCQNETENFCGHLKKLDSSGERLYIIAFSLGTLLVLDALSQIEKPLNNLAHIFLLGGAAPENYNLNQLKIKETTRIINYQSPVRDVALAFAYRYQQKVRAIGSTGFKNHNNYKNLRQYSVNRVHMSVHYNDLSETLPSSIEKNRFIRKAYNIISDIPQKITPSYDTFADCILEKIAYIEGWRHNKGEVITPTILDNYTLGGAIFWDDVCSQQYNQSLYKIQKNIQTNHYRLLVNNRRLASDTSIEVLMDFLEKGHQEKYPHNNQIKMLHDLYPF